MPEGPEIRRAADRLAAALEGQTLRAVEMYAPAPSNEAAGLEGQQVQHVHPRGKALLISFSDTRTLYSHNQLYGRWLIRRRDQPAAAGRRSLRVALHTDKHSALLFSATDIELLDAAGLAAHPYLVHLGPDLLDPGTHWETIDRQLRARQFHNRQLAALYLDQQFVAGIGNYLRSEILFHARVAPVDRPSDLTDAARRRLARSTVTIGARAYASGGITNMPSRAARMKLAGHSRSARRHMVFERHGQPCYRCYLPVELQMFGSRRVFFCPTCQPSRRA